MAMDGARMRDLNTASKLDLAGATVGPIAATTGKVIGATFVIGGFVLSTISCKNDDPGTPIIPCACNPKDHLGIDEKKKCGGIGCTCSEQIASIDGIPVRKVIGVTNAQMNSAVNILDEIYGDITLGMQTALKNNVTEIHIGLAGAGISGAKGGILTIGHDTDGGTIAIYLSVGGFFASLKQFDNSKNTVRMAMFYLSNSKII